MTRILGAVVREVTRGVYAGRVAQLDVHAVRGPSGWRVSAADSRSGLPVAFGVGETLERAERRAQDYFARRIGVAA